MIERLCSLADEIAARLFPSEWTFAEAVKLHATRGGRAKLKWYELEAMAWVIEADGSAQAAYTLYGGQIGADVVWETLHRWANQEEAAQEARKVQVAR